MEGEQTRRTPFLQKSQVERRLLLRSSTITVITDEHPIGVGRFKRLSSTTLSLTSRLAIQLRRLHDSTFGQIEHGKRQRA